jgi:hypothetical protein
MLQIKIQIKASYSNRLVLFITEYTKLLPLGKIKQINLPNIMEHRLSVGSMWVFV